MSGSAAPAPGEFVDQAVRAFETDRARDPRADLARHLPPSGHPLYPAVVREQHPPGDADALRAQDPDTGRPADADRANRQLPGDRCDHVHVPAGERQRPDGRRDDKRYRGQARIPPRSGQCGVGDAAL